MRDLAAASVNGNRQRQRGSVVPWEPDVLLAAQLARRATRTPEHTLLLAVLEQALRDLSYTARHTEPRDITRRQRSFRRDVIAWFQSNSRAYITDFIAICEVFGLEPSAVRRALDRLDWRPQTTPTHGVRVRAPGRHMRLVIRRLRA